MEDTICRARIETEFSKIFKLLPVAFIIMLIVFSIPVEERRFPTGSYACYNVVGDLIGFRRDGIYRSNYFSEFFDVIFGFYSWSLALVTWFLIIWLIIMAVIKYDVKGCSLQLDKNGITGNRTKFFKNNSIYIPIEKIYSISKENRFIDKILGGETVYIRSASGFIRFICVQNAPLFIDEILNAIKVYKESDDIIYVQEEEYKKILADGGWKCNNCNRVNQSFMTTCQCGASKPNVILTKMPIQSKAESKIPQNTSKETSSAVDEILKLKQLLDAGVLTQEEFDAKKKQLLGL